MSSTIGEFAHGEKISQRKIAITPGGGRAGCLRCGGLMLVHGVKDKLRMPGVMCGLWRVRVMVISWVAHKMGYEIALRPFCAVVISLALQ